MFKFISSLFIGAIYPIKAMAFIIQNPQIQGFIIIPILINFLVGIALYFGSFTLGLHQIDLITTQIILPDWANAGGITLYFLVNFIKIILALILLLITGFLLVQFGIILGSPWYGMLSENLEKIKLGELPLSEPMTFGTIIRDINRALLHEIKKLVLGATIGILLLMIGLVPVWGTAIASLGGVALSAILIAIDFFDSPLERRRLSFRQKLSIIVNQLPGSGSFALVSLFLVSIPLLNLLMIPVCITSGTLFFCDRIFPALNQPKN